MFYAVGQFSDTLSPLTTINDGLTAVAEHCYVNDGHVMLVAEGVVIVILPQSSRPIGQRRHVKRQWHSVSKGSNLSASSGGDRILSDISEEERRIREAHAMLDFMLEPQKSIRHY